MVQCRPGTAATATAAAAAAASSREVGDEVVADRIRMSRAPVTFTWLEGILPFTPEALSTTHHFCASSMTKNCRVQFRKRKQAHSLLEDTMLDVLDVINRLRAYTPTKEKGGRGVGRGASRWRGGGGGGGGVRVINATL